MSEARRTAVPESGLARPRVWGIGLTRTGTTSLNSALKILGYRSAHWPTLAQLLQGHLQAATDESVAALYRYLDFRFPQSRFIVTVRSEDAWIESVKLHRARWGRTLSEFAALCRSGDVTNCSYERGVEVAFTQMTLYGTVEFDRDRFLSGYRRFHREVMEYFSARPNDVLYMDICAGEGWTVLCDFLGCEQPSVPFPSERSALSLDQ